MKWHYLLFALYLVLGFYLKFSQFESERKPATAQTKLEPQSAKTMKRMAQSAGL